MPLRTIATFAIAIVLGLIAVVLINIYMRPAHKVQEASAPQGAGTSVVVANAPIARGIVVQPALLKVVTFPNAAVPVGAFHSIADVIGSGGKDQQRIATATLTPGEPVVATAVTQPGQKLNMATELDPGTQAVAIRMNDVTGVGGFVLPNDRVDVMMSRTIPSSVAGRQPTSVTQVLAEDVRVLGVDQSDDQDANKPVVVKAITLELTPEQAQSITLAQTVGTLSLSLRHVEDTARVTRMATTSAAFFGSSSGPALRHAVARRAMGPSVRVTRGTETAVYELSAR